MSRERPKASRRSFLSGRAALNEVRDATRQPIDAASLEDAIEIPSARDTVRLAMRAMATEFAVVMNPGPPERVRLASDALDMLEPLEQKMTVHRQDADLAVVNRTPAGEVAIVDLELFEVLVESQRIARETEGAFDPTSGPLVELWRRCRSERRVPSPGEMAAALVRVGSENVVIDVDSATLRFDRPGVELNLGGIGKGFALDRCAAFLEQEGLSDFVLHGGRSSILARGDHGGQGGWPVGLVDPLVRNTRLATLLLRDQAMSTSGSSIQYFRVDGERYGHILDPRTGWPASGVLSVTVVAPTAAEADALSTAFFVGGVEIARVYCDNRCDVGAVIIPEPSTGRTLQPVVIGIPAEQLFLHAEDVEFTRAEPDER